MIQKRVEGFGIFAPVLFVLMEITHIVLAFIPGGPVEIIGGVLFGAFWGLVYVNRYFCRNRNNI